MIATGKLQRLNTNFRFRPVALPVEHGGWGLLFEPILLGLLLAPSLAGLFVSASAAAAFLARHPFKLAMTDWHRKRAMRRTVLAKRFAIVYASVAIVSLALAIRTSGEEFFLPLVFAAPIAIVQLSYDSVGKSRALVAELAGSLSTGALATAIAICGGWPRPLAFALWVLITARSVPTILYLRARLRLLRQKPAATRNTIVAHLLAVFVTIVLAWEQVAPWLALLAMVILLIRACAGLRSVRPTTPQRLGAGELFFGVFTVAAVSIGYDLGW
jgi:YwiC-like protein